jgi:hypothetical protein
MSADALLVLADGAAATAAWPTAAAGAGACDGYQVGKKRLP